MEERHQRICLIHYHEIGLKGRNRSVFEKRLLKNVEALLSDFPVVTIHRISGRLCVFLREGTTFERALEVAATVRYVPGVARVSCGFKCERDLSVMNVADTCCIRSTLLSCVCQSLCQSFQYLVRYDSLVVEPSE